MSDAIRQTLTLPAPAKINLFLHVLGRRDDGYHLIESVFAPVAFGDTVTLTVTDHGEITRECPIENVSEENDLTLRAARLLQSAAGSSLGVKIRVKKNVPQGSGLGGGSSDAATVLLALNRLWRVNFSRDELMALGLKLGADIPFFIGGTPAFVTGIGECLAPVTLPPLWVAMAFPGVAVPTAEIFSAKDLTRNTPSGKIAAFRAVHGKNDLEKVAKSRYPMIESARLLLTRYERHARMSGSGSAVFALSDDPSVARSAVLGLEPPFFGVTTRILNRHPLIEWGFRRKVA